jgi:hypothetical protein
MRGVVPPASVAAKGSDRLETRVAAARAQTAEWQDVFDKAALFGGADDLNTVTALYVAKGGGVSSGDGRIPNGDEYEDDAQRTIRATQMLTALRADNESASSEYHFKFDVENSNLMFSGPCQTGYNTAECEAVAKDPEFPFNKPTPLDPPPPRRLPPKLRLRALQIVPKRCVTVKQPAFDQTDMGNDESYVIPAVSVPNTASDTDLRVRPKDPKKRTREQTNSRLNAFVAGIGGGNTRKRSKQASRKPAATSAFQFHFD